MYIDVCSRFQLHYKYLIHIARVLTSTLTFRNMHVHFSSVVATSFTVASSYLIKWRYSVRKIAFIERLIITLMAESGVINKALILEALSRYLM